MVTGEAEPGVSPPSPQKSWASRPPCDDMFMCAHVDKRMCTHMHTHTHRHFLV